MNPKIAKLLHEGFSINTIEKLNDVQLSVLYSRISEQSSGTLNIPKADTESIEKAKSEKKPFVTYEEELGEEDVNEKSVSKQQQKTYFTRSITLFTHNLIYFNIFFE
jgi:hypothetical protein